MVPVYRRQGGTFRGEGTVTTPPVQCRMHGDDRVDHHVDSARNPLIKALARLEDRRGRDATQRYLIEGAREVARALDGGVRPERLLVCPQLAGPALVTSLGRRAREAGAELVTTSLEAFQRLSFRSNPDGVMAVAIARTMAAAEVPIPTAALLLVIDGLEKPGNIGALLRTAEAVGVDGVFLSGEGTDLYNPNVIRASMGSLFALPVAVANATTVRERLEAAGVNTVATSPGATLRHWDADYLGSTAVVLGPEHDGLDAGWLTPGSTQVTVPMQGRLVDSLNVSVTGAVVLYEALRQRAAVP